MPLIVIIYTGALLLVASTALAIGSTTAKRLSWMYVAAQLVSLAVERDSFPYFKVGLFLPDLLLLLGVLWVTIRAVQRWPIACAALQLLTVLGHLAKWEDQRIRGLAYAIMVQWTAWPAVAVLMIGLLLDRRAGRIS